MFNYLSPMCLMPVTWNIKTSALHWNSTFNQLQMTLTSGAGTVNPSGKPLSSPLIFREVHVALSLVLCVMFCRSLFVLFLLAIVVSVLLWFTDSNYPLVSSNSSSPLTFSEVHVGRSLVVCVVFYRLFFALLLVHLDQRSRWTIAITWRPSSVVCRL